MAGISKPYMGMDIDLRCKMKINLFSKIFFSIMTLVSIIIVFAGLLNEVYLEKYYTKQRLKIMENIIKDLQINPITREEREILEEENNVRIMKINNKDMMHKPYNRRRIDRLIRNLSKNDKNNLENGKIISVENLQGPFKSIDAIVYENNEFVIVSTSKVSVNENIMVIKKFFTIIALFSFIFSIFVSYFLSKKIVKPIKNINDVSKAMANLSFEKKCEVNSGDEIEELAKNINYLSHALENKIQDLNIANEKLKKDIENERKMESEKNEFIASVSHELKTPIALINTYIESIVEDIVDDEDKQYYYKVIMDEGNNLSKLIDNLLNFMAKKKEEIIVKESVNIEKMLDSEFAKYKLELDKKGIKTVFDFSPKQKLYVIEKENINIVLNNFFSNAVRHVKENGIIAVKVFEKKDSLIVGIYNSGNKIPEKYMKDIWRPFYRIDKARNRKYGGTGLGLAIVKKILKKNSYEYGVLNKIDGVEFWFEIKS